MSYAYRAGSRLKWGLSRLALALAAFGVAPAALAQTSSGAEASSVDSVVVTASRIVRNGFQAPTPTTVLGADQIQAQAPVHLADVVNDLPQVWNSATPRNVAGLGLGANGGGNFLNLRGLGATRTLTLLDGRRVAPQTTTATVDVNLFPSPLVTRVDVVTGGASAAWGSDAVSGVVNFLLDTKFTGLKGSVEGGETDYGDGQNWKADLTWGRAFAGGRGHFVVSGLLAQTDAISRASTRKWYNANRMLQNPAWAKGNGQPYWIIAGRVGANNLTEGGLITAVSAGVPTSLIGADFLAPDGSSQRFTFGQVVATTSQIGGTFQDGAGYNPLQAGDDQAQIFSHLTYDFSDRVSGFVEALYGKSTTAFDGGSAAQATGGGNPAIVIRQDNAYLPAAIRAQMPVGSTLTLGRANRDGFSSQSTNKREAQRYVAGIDAKLWGDWTLSAYAQYGRSDIEATIEKSVLPARLPLISDAVVVTAANVGTSGLAIGSIACRSTLTAPTNGCVPTNVFGLNVLNPAAIAWASGTAAQTLQLEEKLASAQVSGTLFHTWAGPVSLAAGLEGRRESIVGTADPISIANGFRIGNFRPIAGDYSVTEGFAETVVPLLKDVAFAKAVDVNAAVRRTHYTTSGSVTTWKLGANWSVNDDLRIRGTKSRDIRAPNLNELFASPSTSATTVFDPRNNTNLSTPLVTQGNIDLKPEISKQWGAGFVYRPGWAPGLGLSIDYYDIRISQAITSVSNANLVLYCFNGFSFFCPSVVRNAAGAITQIKSQPVNGSQETEKGFDIELSYQADLERFGLPGRANIRALATNIQDRTVSVGGLTTNILGQLGGTTGAPPRWRGQVNLNYSLGPSSTSLSVRYTGHGVVDNTFTEGGNQELTSVVNNRIEPFTTLDLSQTIDLQGLTGRKIQLYGVVRNLTDAAPPIAVTPSQPASSIGTTSIYDTIGRQYRVGLRFQF